MKSSLFTSLMIVLLLCSFVSAEVPQLINYQGRLTDTNDDPLTGSYSIQFLMFNDLSAGTTIWSETHPAVNITEGVYQVLLGSVTVFPQDLFTSSIDRYLELIIAGETLTPRTRFTSVSYALQASHSDSADVAASAGTASPTGTAGGDLAGSYPNPTVDGIRGRSVSTTAPATDQVLKWTGTAWAPADDVAGGGSVWQSSGNDIYYNSGNIGIGTNTPSTALQVVGTITGTTFAGSGASLTSLNGANINDNSVTTAKISGTIAVADGGTAATTTTVARTNLGLAIGTDVQAYDADLTDLADGSLTGSKIGAGIVGGNINDNSIATAKISGTIAVADGGTAATTTAAARSNLGLTIGTNVQAYDADLTDLADGSLTGSKVGTGISGTNITTGTVADARLEATLNRTNFVASASISALDFITASGGMHVGGTSDPGTDNLIVDGRAGFGTSTLTYPFQLVSGNSTRGMFINHDQSLTGTTYGLQIDLDNTNTGNYSSYGVYSTATKTGGTQGAFGIYGSADGTSTGTKQGVRGSAAGGSGTKYGVYGYGYGTSSSYTKYGVYGIASGSSTASKYGVYGNANSTQSDNKWGVYGVASGGTGSHKGVEGWYSNSHYGYLGGNLRGAEAYYDGTHWAYFASSTRAGYFVGDVHVSGTLTKSAGTFKIDHPLDPANKYLSHSFVESPDMKNIYDGVVTLSENGEATVQLPEWFGTLNIDFRYQLTAIGAPGPNLFISQEITNNEFKIAGGSSSMKVSWQVTGIRNDIYAQKNRIKVEEEKNAEERGKYLHPELYGFSEDMRTETPVKSEQSSELDEPDQTLDLEEE